MRKTRDWVPALMAGVAPLVIVVTWWLWHDVVPEPLPTHWNFNGDVDDTTGGLTFTVVQAVVAAVAAAVAALAALLRTGQPGARHVVAFATGTAWFFAALHFAVVRASVDAVRATDVSLSGWWVAAAITGALTLGVLAAVLSPPTIRSTERPAAPSMPVGRHERVVWVDSASSRWLLGAGLAAGAIAAAMLTAAWPVTVSLAVVGLALVTLHAITVRVDGSGVQVRFGLGGWPRVAVPLSDIASARAMEIVPTEWGGWGYRMTRRGSAVVLRRGPGLVVTRHDGRDFAVTVDSPEEAAALLNGLVAREQTSTAG